jgi:multiple sugar transport system substrate-binding protein
LRLCDNFTVGATHRIARDPQSRAEKQMFALQEKSRSGCLFTQTTKKRAHSNGTTKAPASSERSETKRGAATPSCRQEFVERKVRVRLGLPLEEAQATFIVCGGHGMKIVCVAICLLAGLCAACGGGGGERGVEVTFWHAMGGPLGDALDELVQRFNAEHPDINVRPINMGSYQALSQKLFASIEAGNPPTVAQVYENWTANFIEAGAIVPLDDYASGPEGLEDTEDIFPVFLAGNTFDDKLWTFPFNKGVPAIYFNADMFAESGVDTSGPPATWEELRKAAAKLTVSENGRITRYGMVFTVPSALAMFEAVLLENGGSQLDSTLTKATFNSPVGVASLQFIYDLVAKDSAAYMTSGSYEHQSEFAAGSCAMIQSYITSLVYMEPQITFSLGMGPIPAGEKRVVQISGTNLAIFAAAKVEQRDAAWTFISWLTSTENTAEWAARTGYLPVRRSAFSDPTLLARFEAVPGLEATMRQVEHAVAQPQSAEWYEGRKYLEEDAIERVMRGLMTPQEGLDAAAKRLDEILAKRETD